MPKVSKIQTNFNAGEVSQSVMGRVDSERYDTGMQTLTNYIPVLQGPISRRPGTKYVGEVKDSTSPPILIPFNAAGNQGYIVECGVSGFQGYLRFYSKDGQITINTTVFTVRGTDNTTIFPFQSVRDSINPETNEMVTSTSSTNIGPLEILTPFLASDIATMRWAQKDDTLYLATGNNPVYKLQRKAPLYWNFKQVAFQDGPYLGLNSYSSLGDYLNVDLRFDSDGNLITGPNLQIAGIAGSGGKIRVNITGHGFATGDQVVITGVVGTSEANNYNSSAVQQQWVVTKVDSDHFDLNGSTFVNAYVGSGRVSYALFKYDQQAPTALDTGRNIALSNPGIGSGHRYWGYVLDVIDRHKVQIVTGPYNPSIGNSGIFVTWQLGVWVGGGTTGTPNYPTCVTFHQNRLMFGGGNLQPLQLNGSMINGGASGGTWETFSASGSNFITVNDDHALQFSLTASEPNPIYWLKSVAQGLLVGSYGGEYQIQPNTQAGALTPTNITSQAVANFGAARIEPVQYGNSVVYLQKGQRKVRELNYFFQVGTFRSTNLSEMSEHITLPSITQLAVQKEVNPVIWGLRSDGQLISLTYNRDEFSVKAGFAKHVLGGQSDAAGTPPNIQSMAVMQASSALYDELWLAVQRSIAGTNVCTIEYMTKPFQDNSNQEDAYYLDCGATYDNPIAVSSITNAPSCVITTGTSHLFTASSYVIFNSAVGVGTSIINTDGVKFTSNLVNYGVFQVASVSATSFKIQDSLGNDIDSTTYSAYLGSSVVRKLVHLVTGANWLSNETNVSLLGDGSPIAGTTVSNVGSIGLSTPAAKVQIGYAYDSDGQMLRTKDGSAQGTAIGSTRRVNRVAFMLHNVGELSVGPTFQRLLPIEFAEGDANNADTAFKLFNGVTRQSFEGDYTYSDTICFRQSVPLPGMIQAIVRFYEEQDV